MTIFCTWAVPSAISTAMTSRRCAERMCRDYGHAVVHLGRYLHEERGSDRVRAFSRQRGAGLGRTAWNHLATALSGFYRWLDMSGHGGAHLVGAEMPLHHSTHQVSTLCRSTRRHGDAPRSSSVTSASSATVSSIVILVSPFLRH
jgi:hypothetical protein